MGAKCCARDSKQNTLDDKLRYIDNEELELRLALNQQERIIRANKEKYIVCLPQTATQ